MEGGYLFFFGAASRGAGGLGYNYPARNLVAVDSTLARIAERSTLAIRNHLGSGILEPLPETVANSEEAFRCP
ncbi:hypothetical protein [Polaromonas sp. LjRoot131]|uniref:hypothetical protein n=1 Tax=Polaromonas sp. LjRoot131 TaxID=3342262 RepID=UPI003ED07F93